MNQTERWALLFKALSEPIRLRLLNLLREAGSLCVCDLVALLDSSQSMVSRHLAYLRHAGWVESHRQGLWIHYRMNVGDDPHKAALLATLAAMAREDPVLRDDLERLRNTCNKTGVCC